MRKKSLICFVFIVFSLGAMQKSTLVPEPKGSKETEEMELALKTLKIGDEPKAPKELSEEIQKQIKWLKGLAERGEFSNEVASRILLNLAKVKMRGGTEEQKLYNAIESIRAFMEAFPQFYGDKQINKELIEELANKYTGGQRTVVALALATQGAGQWLVEFVGSDDYRISILVNELVKAAKHNQLGKINFILTYFPQIINKRDSEGLTALITATVYGRMPIVERLLKVPGIDVNADDKEKGTALIAAVFNNHPAIMERLLQVSGININAQNNDGSTALIMAIEYNRTAIAERLLQVPTINVNAQDTEGFNALMHAVFKGDMAIVKKLLQISDINVNGRAQDGTTALTLAHVSSSPNKQAIIKLLEAHGATE